LSLRGTRLVRAHSGLAARTVALRWCGNARRWREVRPDRRRPSTFVGATSRWRHTRGARLFA
jgi:hypothetical protein